MAILFFNQVLYKCFETFVTGTVGHTGYSSCTYCWQIGQYSNRRVVFEASKGRQRTDQEFRNYVDQAHHIGHTILTDNPLIRDMIFHFPIDCMHALDLGVVKKIIKLYLKLKSFDPDLADNFIVRVLKFIPGEFTRKPRSLKNIEHYKAAEFRLFALYLAPVLLKESNVNSTVYDNFMNFFVAYRLLLGEEGVVHPDNCNLAESLLEEFVRDFKDMYGELSFNFHSLLHLADVVRHHGPLDRYSAYKFENWYQLLRKWIRKPSDLFKQVHTRWLQNKGMVQRKSLNRKNFNSLILSTSIKNNCIMTVNGEISLITKKIVNPDGITFEAKKFTNRQSFFSQPVNSSELNIFVVSETSLATTATTIRLNQIKRKMFRMPYGSDFVVMPILHSQ